MSGPFEVAMPVREGLPDVVGAVRSALDQSPPPVEVVVAAAASSDGTAAAVRAAAGGPRP